MGVASEDAEGLGNIILILVVCVPTVIQTFVQLTSYYCAQRFLREAKWLTEVSVDWPEFRSEGGAAQYFCLHCKVCHVSEILFRESSV